MGADIAALEKRPEGWAVTDMFSSDYDAPVRDAVAQDVVLLQEPEKTEEGTWVFMYKRPLETGDVDDRDILEGEDQNFVWQNASSNASNRAYGQGPTMNDHGDHRGYSRLQLYPYDIWEDSTGIDITDGADALAASVDLINIGEGVANAAAKVPSKVIELDGVDGFDGNEMPAERDCAAAEFVLAGVAMAMMMLGALRAGWSTEISAAGFMRGLVLDVDEEAGKVAVDGGEKRRMETKGRME
ncbi:hypothetical protein HK101_009639 [Irineochytrium annulatum]|nr:hypothetical protein HK101_009639 [Irineochytrium annulatum]